MVLEDVRIALSNQLAQLDYDAPLVLGARCFQDGRESTAVAYGDQENTPPVRIKRGRLQVELESVQIFVSQSPKIHPPGLHEELFDRTNLVVGIGKLVEAIH